MFLGDGPAGCACAVDAGRGRADGLRRRPAGSSCWAWVVGPALVLSLNGTPVSRVAGGRLLGMEHIRTTKVVRRGELLGSSHGLTRQRLGGDGSSAGRTRGGLPWPSLGGHGHLRPGWVRRPPVPVGVGVPLSVLGVVVWMIWAAGG